MSMRTEVGNIDAGFGEERSVLRRDVVREILQRGSEGFGERFKKGGGDCVFVNSGR